MATTHPTFEDVWRMFQETDRLLKESAQETERKFQETDRVLKESAQETERKFQETDRRLRELSELFTGQWGKLMESLVEGDLVKILNDQGIAVRETSTRIKGHTPEGQRYEFDIVAHDGDTVIVVEVKTTLRPQHVKRFVGKLEAFKGWIPRYAGNTVHGAMAYLTADANAETMAERRGLFVIRATGNSAHVVNAKGFRPRGW